MCGICGIVDRSGPVEPGVLEAVTDTLRHRGPDDEGYHLAPGDGGTPAVGLGFRRLAIIDLETGNQPLQSEDGAVLLVFNGEIYNFRELRRELEERGHRFATSGDAEVIVHLYEEVGADCVHRLNGMFAFAVWDARSRTLFCARDRLGKKPLYYTATPERILFASELKALLRHPACPRELDRDALSMYLAAEYVPSPHTILRGVAKLPAAHRLTWREGETRVERYWEFPTVPDERPRRDEEYVDDFRARLEEAVRLRLVSDVPLGAFLSGGIDSSSVVALMARHLPAGALRTFSIGFHEESFDESRHARRVAAAVGAEHHEEVFTPGVMLDVLPEVVAGMDEPFADASLLPTFLLSRFARRSVTVALGGDGADELLAGYPTFQADRLARLYPLPRAVHERVAAPIAGLLPTSTANFSLDFKLRRFLLGMSYPDEIRHQVWLGSFPPAAQAALLMEAPRDPYRETRALLAAPGDRLSRLIALYAQTYLADDILAKVDRASMACSLEVRAPFLDFTLVEFLAAVPSRLKLRGLQTKVLLKRAMGSELPSGIAGRRKKGFGIPLARWFKGALREALEDELSPARLDAQGIFRPTEVQRLLREHLAGRRDHRKELWTLLVFQLWHRGHLEQAAPPVAASIRAAR